jgi:hypothetical protein
MLSFAGNAAFACVEMAPEKDRTVSGTDRFTNLPRDGSRQNYGQTAAHHHSRRALWTFRRVFEERQTQVGLEPVDTDPLSPPATWWLHLLGWQTVPTEYPKLIFYWLRFRM